MPFVLNVLRRETCWVESKQRLDLSAHESTTQTPGRALDHYIEAQVHGEIRLDRDVQVLVIDPAFRGTATGASLEVLARRYGLEFRCHPGFSVGVEAIPSDFRGAEIPQLAGRIANRPEITAVDIGIAAANLHDDPTDWKDWASPEATLQHLKQLWHVLVQFG